MGVSGIQFGTMLHNNSMAWAQSIGLMPVDFWQPTLASQVVASRTGEGMEGQDSQKEPDKKYAVVLTTVDTPEAAERISAALLDAHLAACVQQLAVASSYDWQGQRCQDSEQLLLIKTRAELYAQLEALLLELHPYELPQIIQLPIQTGLPAYLAWLDSCLTAPGQ